MHYPSEGQIFKVQSTISCHACCVPIVDADHTTLCATVDATACGVPYTSSVLDHVNFETPSGPILRGLTRQIKFARAPGTGTQPYTVSQAKVPHNTTMHAACAPAVFPVVHFTRRLLFSGAHSPRYTLHSTSLSVCLSLSLSVRAGMACGCVCGSNTHGVV